MTHLSIVDTLRPLGCSLLMSLWYSTALAVFVACLSRSRHGSSPHRRHAIALGSLMFTLALAVGTWALLTSPPDAVQSSVASTGPGPRPLRTGSVMAEVVVPGPSSLPVGGLHPASWAGWLAVTWLVAVGLLALRLAAGLSMTWWIRHRATRLSAGSVADAVARLSKPVGMRRAVGIFESAALECPIAIGWARPELVVPVGIDVTLERSHLEPVIAHELEHLRRRDQWAALVQVVADAFLFFCPGARWMSRHVREAREQECDDVAIRVCGDRAAYATALGVLASRATGTWASAVMGNPAPSLVRRIKRILKGDTMQSLSRGQWLSVVAALTITIITGVMMFGASLDAAREAELTARNRATASGPQGVVGAAAVPTGMVPEQDGSPIRVLRATGDQEFCFSRVGVRNISEKPVISVTFIGVVEHASRTEPAIVVRSTPVAVSLEPGAAADLSMTFLPIGDVLQWRSAKGYKAQATLGLVEVGFADGDRWVMTPPTDAVRENDVFHRSTPEVSRALLSGPQHVGPTGAPCRDDRGLGFSVGALVRIKGETDAFAVCTKSGWTEQKSPNGEPRLWVSIAPTLAPEVRAGAEVMPAPYSGSPCACMRATGISDRTGDRSRVCFRSWAEAGRARVIVFAVRGADDTDTQDLDTFLLAAGESHEVAGTARIGAVGMTVSAAAPSRLKQ